MNWWHYLLLVNIYLALFYVFYGVLLRKETFFQLNRVYLVTAAVLSFFIPLIQADWVQHLFITEQVRYSIYGSGANIYSFQPIEHTRFTIGQLFTYLYVTGITFLSIRFILQLIRVNKMMRNPAPSAAYSFFKKISLGERLTKQETILAHEEVHARQWHSIDVLIIEAVMIVNWFNPVVYLYRFAIKHIHEFIADQQALKIGANKAEYALLLLSQTFNAPAHQLINPFYNHSLLKKRIMMLQKNRSQRIVLFKYVLSAPLFGLMLILSSATVNNSKAITVIHDHADNLFQKPAITTINNVTNNGEIPEQSITSKNTVTITTPVDETNPVIANDGKLTEIDSAASGKLYESVETEPSFTGGLQAFYDFLSKTLKYPKEARDNNITGKVFIRFVVEKDGSLSGIKAVRGPEHGLNEEAERAIKLSPKWAPGIQNGKVVRVQYTVPVNFSLEGDEKKSRQNYTGDKVYNSVDIEPTFAGGIQAFYQYLGKNIRYPAAMREKKIQGKVFVQYVVETDGSLSNVKAVRGPGYGAEEESVRVISASPKWKPGMQNGKAVRVQYTVPVNFSLIDSKPVGAMGTFVKKDSSHLRDSKNAYLLTGPSIPLYLVDGKEVDDINTINSKNILSIEILKDVAAQPYGDKGINGVILIHTKNKPAAPAQVGQ